jgi:hypothetical protein
MNRCGYWMVTLASLPIFVDIVSAKVTAIDDAFLEPTG